MELGKIVEEPGSENDAIYLVSLDETSAMCPPGSPSLSAANNKDPHQFQCAEIDVFKSKHVTSPPPKIHLKTCLWSKDGTGQLKSDSSPLSNGHRTLSGNNTEPLKPEPLLSHKKSLKAQQESTEPLQEDTPPTQDPKLSAIPDNTKDFNSAHCVTSLVGSLSTKQDPFPTSTTENLSGLLAAKSETFKAAANALKQEKLCEKTSLMESGLCTDLKRRCLKSASKSSPMADSLPQNPSTFVNTELEEVNSTSAKSSCKEKADTILMCKAVLKSSKLHDSIAECGLTGAHKAKITFLHEKQEAVTDFCHAEEQTMSSALCPAEGDASAEMQPPASDNKQLDVADAEWSTGAGNLVLAEGGNTKEPIEPELLESKPSNVPERQEGATLPKKESEMTTPAALEDTEVTQEQVDIILKLNSGNFLLFYTEALSSKNLISLVDKLSFNTVVFG